MSTPEQATTGLQSGSRTVLSWFDYLDRMPVRTFEEITSVYGEPRGSHYHAGVDYKAPQGTPVYTVTGGRVTRTNWNTSYNGLCVELDFGGYAELFLHLHTIHDGVVPGTLLEPGDQIGTVGNTGVSTAPHLHYQINDPQGHSIDPYLFFSSHRRSLTSDDMEDFMLLVEACRTAMGR
jgi:murein DD-endopeptidase